MRNFLRLLRYGLPYTLQWMPGVLLLAVVGVLDTLRVALFVPILGVVLKPQSTSSALPLFPSAPPRWRFDVHSMIPAWMHMHNVLTVIAVALIGSTLVKGICDYTGTYLVNYAGFGTITDLRNRLYETIIRRSSSFFHRHPTGTILSTLINDVDRVQTALSSVLGDFLQQFFTFAATVCLVIALGGRLSWALLLFVPVVITSARRIGRSVRKRTRTGQDKLAEIQNILHETVTGNRIVKAFNTEIWEILRFQKAAKRLFRANLHSVRVQSISSPLMDTIGSIAIALLLWIGRNEIEHGRMTAEVFITFIIALFKLTIRYAGLPRTTTASSRRWALRPPSSPSSIPRTTSLSARARPRWCGSARPSALRTWASSIRMWTASSRFCTTSTWRCAPAKCWRW
jgi:ATP-binding cassette, subfamily B, bacterial MsbA